MTSQPVIYEPFPDVDHEVELEDEFDLLNPVRGIVIGIALCAPFWVGVYWMFRSV
jgi:hypothetical protein